MGNLRDRKIDSITTAVVNFNGRQVKNAADAVDSQDYVTLSQLKKSIGRIKPSIVQETTSGAGSNTYILIVDGRLAIGSNLAGKRVITKKGVPTAIRFDLDIAATGHTIDVDIYQNGSLYLSASIPATSINYSVPMSVIQAAGFLTKDNYLRIDITAVGSTNPGLNLYCTIQQ